MNPPHRGHQATWGGFYSRNGQTCSSLTGRTSGLPHQLDGIVLDEVFEDRASGRDTKRPQLEAMLRYVRRGDTVICHSMDRLARNLDDLRKLVTDLTRRGVQVRFVKENLT